MFDRPNSNMDRLTMVTFNCTGLYADRTDFIHDFIFDNHVDILCLQETWLHETEFKYIKKTLVMTS